jgi:hypothetical protein
MTALIPGINNVPSVGTRPTCRGGKAIVSSSLYGSRTPLAMPTDEGHVDRPAEPPSKLNKSVCEECTPLHRALDMAGNGGHANLLGRAPGPAKSSNDWNAKYNPITNPIPNNVQNPYILKQRMHAISEIGQTKLDVSLPFT